MNPSSLEENLRARDNALKAKQRAVTKKKPAKSQKRSIMCLGCRKRFVPEGRAVAQTCAFCGVVTPKKKATDNQVLRLADDLFSLWIRLRDSNCNGMVSCVTCNASNHYTEVDCGHFVKRGHHQTRFDEDNCHGQCRPCNRPVGSNRHHKDLSWEFGRNIDLLCGDGTAEELKHAQASSFRYNRAGLFEIARKYLSKLETDTVDYRYVYILDRYPAAVVEMRIMLNELAPGNHRSPNPRTRTHCTDAVGGI